MRLDTNSSVIIQEKQNFIKKKNPNTEKTYSICCFDNSMDNKYNIKMR